MLLCDDLPVFRPDPNLRLRFHQVVSLKPNSCGLPTSMPNLLPFISMDVTFADFSVVALPFCVTSLTVSSERCHQPNENSHPSNTLSRSFFDNHSAPFGKSGSGFDRSHNSEPARNPIVLAMEQGFRGKVPRRSVRPKASAPRAVMMARIICSTSFEA